MTQRQLEADHQAFRLHRLECLEAEIQHFQSVSRRERLWRAYHSFLSWLR